jgi:hypothetical protein
LCFSPDIIRLINGRKMRWPENAAHTKFCLESLQRRDHSEDLVVYEDNIKIDLKELRWENAD